jgi:hypothetical protein
MLRAATQTINFEPKKPQNFDSTTKSAGRKTPKVKTEKKFRFPSQCWWEKGKKVNRLLLREE